MKANEKKETMLIEEGSRGSASKLPDDRESSLQRFKKPLIFALIGIVFAGCMYLIFNPSKDNKEAVNLGINDNVPQAADKEMQADKEKAYEQEMLEQKEQLKRNALTTLADYWKEDTSSENETEKSSAETEQSSGYDEKKGKENTALSNYRNAQRELGSFYQNDNSETQQLRKQLDELKGKLAEKDVPASVTVDDQLALMEKSYQMAAKYLPSAGNSKQGTVTDTALQSPAAEKKASNFTAFTQAQKNTVSGLNQKLASMNFSADPSQIKDRGFYAADEVQQAVEPANSVKACVDQTQTVISEGDVQLRLLEPAHTPAGIIPKGTILTAKAKIQTGRLQLRITSIEIRGNITSVDLTGYDLDGQQGLYVPYSPERNAFTEMAGNMSQQSAANLSLTQSAGQQIAADLSRGIVQGISGYFSKKVRMPKVILKSGYQVFLVCKK